MHPYQSLPESAFWRTAVAGRGPLEITGLWKPKFTITAEDRVATAGSCFAQHIGRALKERGYGWMNAEKAPAGLSAEQQRRFNYGVFSCRTGNIYTAAALRQWVTWALDPGQSPAEAFEKDGRWYDPFRPAIEPNGFASADDLLASRQATLRALRKLIEEADVFVFTMGLTEAWVHRESGLEYAMCPGTVAGTFIEGTHVFCNHRFKAILRQMHDAIARMRSVNPDLRVLLTVSPVPLTATASGLHVLTATMQSKSTLRAVAGELAHHDGIDYFPSYEMISAFPFRGSFFEDNLRTVRADGVGFVMDSFFAGCEAAPSVAKQRRKKVRGGQGQDGQALVCEEELLDAFS